MVGATAGGIDVSERTQRDISGMDGWATQFGVQKSDGYQLTSNDNVDFSVMTNVDLPTGSPVVFVPSGMVLSSSKVYEEYGPGMLGEAEGQLAQAGLEYQVPLFRLFVKVLAEYSQGQNSPYFPYFNAMPRLYNNGASMTNACFDCLPPYAAWLAVKERTNKVNFHKALRFVPNLNGPEICDNDDLVKWAYNVATTRSFEWNGDRIIAPMADMFNHGTETEVELSVDGEGNVQAYTKRDVPAGSPLRVSLGDPTNPSPIFATYGFLDDSCPATFCKMMDKQDEMAALGLDFGNLLFFKETGEISGEVWDVVLYSVLAQDPNLQQGFYQAFVNGDGATKQQYHQEYFPYTLEAMRTHVDDTLRELDVLSAKARSYDLATHPRVPVILQHNEFVKQTFLRVKAGLDAM
jgi:hypothetical protein